MEIYNVTEYVLSKSAKVWTITIIQCQLASLCIHRPYPIQSGPIGIVSRIGRGRIAELLVRL